MRSCGINGSRARKLAATLVFNAPGWIGSSTTGRSGSKIDEMNRMAAELLDGLQIKIKPTAKMYELSMANVQLAEIAKAVSYNSDLIIMDEPTSAITEAEVEGLFKIIRSLKAQGCGASDRRDGQDAPGC
jgi:ABC-type sugar transport system ATPase subunit